MKKKVFTDITEARKAWCRLTFDYEKVFTFMELSGRKVKEVVISYTDDQPHKRTLEEVVELIERESVNAMTKHMLHLFAEEYMKQSKEAKK